MHYFWKRHAVYILFNADWNKIGEYRQYQIDHKTKCENMMHVDWDYKVGGKVLVKKDGILCKAESKYDNDPWTIMSVHTNGTIRVQHRTKSECLNIKSYTILWLNVKQLLPHLLLPTLML